MLSILEFFNDSIVSSALTFFNSNTVKVVCFVTGASLFYGIHKIKQRKYIPQKGPPYIPLMGTFLFLSSKGTVSQSVYNIFHKYDTPIFLLKCPLQAPVYVIGNYEIAKEVLIVNSHKSKYRPKHPQLQQMKDRRGRGIAAANGKQFLILRKFFMEILYQHGLGKDALEMKVCSAAETLGEVLESLSLKSKTGLYPLKCFKSATSSIICQIVFGEKFDYDDPDFVRIMYHSSERIKYSDGLRNLAPQELFKKMLHQLGLKKNNGLELRAYHWQALLEYYKIQIQNHKERFDPNSISDMIDAFLLEQLKGTDRNEFTDESLLQLINDMFVAGTDPISCTLLWCIFLINKFPFWLTKCREELDRVVGRSRVPRYSDCQQLPMVMATILECQRYSGAMPSSLPYMANDDIFIKDVCTIPAGAHFIYAMLNDFRRKDFWPKPHEFNPEANFLNLDGSLRKTEHFNPFSLGPRKCMGMKLAMLELFIFFTHLVHVYDMKLDPAAEMKRVQRLIILPGEFNMSFVKRTD